ncbi:DUF4352 domain-containing protein [Aquibacillus sediminis]|uniref:DUF4352 domain-containing protein n=1 Tax=Aquibacillus sediminis TaxID=2574734 RepID=UPI001109401A|nr:DUF4352 domain-containing protein [Aquibacillus sediminis]
MKKLLKWIGIVFAAFIVIGIIASIGEEEPAATTDNQPNAEEEVAADVETESTSSDEDTADQEEESAETSAEASTFHVGDEVSVGDLAYIVHGVETTDTIGSGNEFMDDLTTNGKFVIIDLSVMNNDSEARFIDSEMFRLIEDDGTEYSPTSDADMYINDGDIGFFLEEVNPKMDMRGKVAFEVHNEFSGVMQVSSGFGWSGGEYEEIAFE